MNGQCGKMGVIDTLTGNLAYLVLLILLIIYIPLFIYVRKNPKMAERGIVTYGPCIMFKTKRGVELLDRIAKHKRFWAAFGVVSKIMAFFLMAMMVFIMLLWVVRIPQMAGMEGIGAEYALAIPGLNPMLPLVYGIIGLVVAVVIHEMAHGIQTRANDMNVEAVGILHMVVPIGAFVEPNEEQINKCGRKARSSMFAAGIAVNLTAAIILFLVMSFGLMGTLSASPQNSGYIGDKAAIVNVSAGSPAAFAARDSDIGYSSVILGTWNGITKSIDPMTYDELMDHNFGLTNTYPIVYQTKDGVAAFPVDVYMGVYIEGVLENGPAGKAGIESRSFIVSIDTIPVDNINQFREIMKDYGPDGTKYLSKPVIEYAAYENNVLAPSSSVPVDVEYRNGSAYIGVYISLSGFSLTTPDTVLEAAKNPFHDASSASDAAYAALSYIGMPWNGYSPIPQELQWWYSSDFMPDNVFWVLTQAVFWIFWINLALGICNALPAVPFDGGYLMRDGIGAIVDRVKKDAPAEQREKTANSISSAISYATLFLFIMVFALVIF